MKRIRRLAPPLLLLLVVAAAVIWFYQSRSKPTAEAAGSAFTQVVEARQGNISSNITVVGELEAVQSQTLSFSKMSGTAKLQSITVKAGNTVKAGQTLATIDPAPYKQALDQATSDVQAAEEKLAKLKAPASALDVAKADLAIAKAGVQQQQAADALDDLIHPDLAKLQAALANAQRTLAQAKADLAKLQADKADDDQLARLRDAEAKAADQYTRLANESTPASDASYRDRLLLAYNALANAQDARMTAEGQQKVDALKAQMQVTKTTAAVADAQQALADAQAGGDKLALARAQLAVKDADVALQTSKASRADLDRGVDATTLAAAQADVEKKKLALADAQATLTGATLTAPFDGTVLVSRLTTGSQVGPTTGVVTVANLQNLQVAASVDETSIRRVKAGQNTTITFDALSGQTFRGKVLSVPLEGALQGNVTVYEVPVSITGAESAPLLVGMTANVQIQVAQASNVVLVPTLALQEVNGKYQVLVPSAEEGGEPQARPVEVGLSDGTYTQIVSGLKAGDKILAQLSAAAGTNQNRQNQGQQGGFPGGAPPGGGVIIGPGGGAPPGAGR